MFTIKKYTSFLARRNLIGPAAFQLYAFQHNINAYTSINSPSKQRLEQYTKSHILLAFEKVKIKLEFRKKPMEKFLQWI